MEITRRTTILTILGSVERLLSKRCFFQTKTVSRWVHEFTEAPPLCTSLASPASIHRKQKKTVGTASKNKPIVWRAIVRKILGTSDGTRAMETKTETCWNQTKRIHFANPSLLLVVMVWQSMQVICILKSHTAMAPKPKAAIACTTVVPAL